MGFSPERSVIQCSPLSSMASHASLYPSELSYRNRPAHWKPPSVRRYSKTVVPRPESRTMRYELTDRYCRTRREACPEWMIDVSSTAIFWVLGLARHGVICRNVTAHILPAITASSAGAASWHMAGGLFINPGYLLRQEPG